MASNLHIENLSDDNGKSLFRAQRIRLGGKQAVTPSRALEPARLNNSAPIALDGFSFAEVYRELDRAQIEACQRDSSALDAFSAKVRSAFARAPSSAFRLCLAKYVPDSRMAWPDQAATDLLCDVVHTYSDIVPLPSIDRRLELSDYDKLENFVRSCYRSIERLNNKPVMAYLPTLPREAYPKLLRFYLREGIRSFYFDFEGRMPDHLKLRPVLTALSEARLLDDSLIYGLNARPGRFLRNANVILSRDFIAHGYGVDVLGGRHVRPPFFPPPPERGKQSRLESAIEAGASNKRRLFLKADYGYHRITSEPSASRIYPKDSRVPFQSLFGNAAYVYENIFNMEQQSMEALSLGHRLQHLARGESILTYLETKSQVEPELPKLRRSRQRNLAEFEP